VGSYVQTAGAVGSEKLKIVIFSVALLINNNLEIGTYPFTRITPVAGLKERTSFPAINFLDIRSSYFE
jgi:hypothetical protein